MTPEEHALELLRGQLSAIIPGIAFLLFGLAAASIAAIRRRSRVRIRLWLAIFLTKSTSSSGPGRAQIRGPSPRCSTCCSPGRGRSSPRQAGRQTWTVNFPDIRSDSEVWIFSAMTRGILFPRQRGPFGISTTLMRRRLPGKA